MKVLHSFTPSARPFIPQSHSTPEKCTQPDVARGPDVVHH